LTQKIRVGAVSYLNTKPLVYGFEQGMMKDEIDLLIDYPSKVADMLISDRIDIGLIPVAAIRQLKEHYIISDYCIACNGEVASVCLFSDVPVNEIKTILLDYQSKTSVALLKILLKEFWKISPELVPADKGYENNIKGTTAGLVIGDRAFKQRTVSGFIYDLGSVWKEMTGLPFVFAVWVSNKKMDAFFVENFNRANAAGIHNIQKVIDTNTNPYYDLVKYFTVNIKYSYSVNYQKALDEFMQKMLLMNEIASIKVI
jgi:chorismate dehydratase